MKKGFVPAERITLGKRIKVRLDHRTMIIINRISSLAVWKKLYPKAQIVH